MLVLLFKVIRLKLAFSLLHFVCEPTQQRMWLSGSLVAVNASLIFFEVLILKQRDLLLNNLVHQFVITLRIWVPVDYLILLFPEALGQAIFEIQDVVLPPLFPLDMRQSPDCI